MEAGTNWLERYLCRRQCFFSFVEVGGHKKSVKRGTGTLESKKKARVWRCSKKIKAMFGLVHC